MKTEIEVKILDVDKVAVVKRLEELGATFEKVYNQKRYTYDLPKREDEKKWIRLRNDGVKTTLCYKNIQSDKIDGTKEVEFEVASFDTANEFLECIGIPHKSYQENIRTRYILNGVEIDIDCWPRIPVLVEIEGNSEKEVMDMVKTLNLENHTVTSLGIMDIYKMYGIDLDTISVLKF